MRRAAPPQRRRAECCGIFATIHGSGRETSTDSSAPGALAGTDPGSHLGASKGIDPGANVVTDSGLLTCTDPGPHPNDNPLSHIIARIDSNADSST